jgi:hypothetical protein
LVLSLKSFVTLRTGVPMVVYKIGQLNIEAGNDLKYSVSKYLFIHNINGANYMHTMYNNGWSGTTRYETSFRLEFLK